MAIRPALQAFVLWLAGAAAGHAATTGAGETGAAVAGAAAGAMEAAAPGTAAVSRAAASRCDRLEAGSDGVPAGYYREECRGRAALADGDASAAVLHYRAALSFTLPDGVNYLLKPDLAEALCRQGQVAAAQAELREFQCLAEVESGRRDCRTADHAPPACVRWCATTQEPACQAHLEVLPVLEQHARVLMRECARMSRTDVPGVP